MEGVVKYAGMVVDPQTPKQEMAARVVGIALTAALFAKTSQWITGRRMPSTWLKLAAVTLPPATTLAAGEVARRVLNWYNTQPAALPVPATENKAAEVAGDTSRERLKFIFDETARLAKLAERDLPEQDDLADARTAVGEITAAAEKAKDALPAPAGTLQHAVGMAASHILDKQSTTDA